MREDFDIVPVGLIICAVCLLTLVTWLSFNVEKTEYHEKQEMERKINLIMERLEIPYNEK